MSTIGLMRLRRWPARVFPPGRPNRSRGRRARSPHGPREVRGAARSPSGDAARRRPTPCPRAPAARAAQRRITAERACARSRSQPGTRRRSLPRPRGRWSPPMCLLRKDYSSHHATRGRAPLAPLGAEDEAHLAGRVACWASLFSTLIHRRCTGGVRCQGSGGIPSPAASRPFSARILLRPLPLTTRASV